MGGQREIEFINWRLEWGGRGEERSHNLEGLRLVYGVYEAGKICTA